MRLQQLKVRDLEINVPLVEFANEFDYAPVNEDVCVVKNFLAVMIARPDGKLAYREQVGRCLSKF